MKKTGRKLALSRDTVRNLSAPSIREAAGASLAQCSTACTPLSCGGTCNTLCTQGSCNITCTCPSLCPCPT